jgi:hypothetical protein
VLERISRAGAVPKRPRSGGALLTRTAACGRLVSSTIDCRAASKLQILLRLKVRREPSLRNTEAMLIALTVTFHSYGSSGEEVTSPA